MGPASAATPAFCARSRAAAKTASFFGWSSATTRTAALPLGCSCHPPARLVSRVHTLPPCTPPGVPQTQLSCNVLELKCGGLLLDRHKTPLTWRFVVYYCAAVYTVDRPVRRRKTGTCRRHCSHANR